MFGECRATLTCGRFSMHRKALLAVVLVLAVEIGALALVHFHASKEIAGGYGFPLDDSWIHAYFARNVAEGKGIVYNPGQHVSSTAILYTLALSATYKLTSNPVFNADALGLLLHLGASLLIFAIARRLSLGDGAALVAAIVFAAVPRLIWAALSGMEVSLYVFLVTLGIYWHVRYRWFDGARAYLATLAFALAALARPECGTFVVASMIERLISSHRFDSDKGGALRCARTLPGARGCFCHRDRAGGGVQLLLDGPSDASRVLCEDRPHPRLGHSQNSRHRDRERSGLHPPGDRCRQGRQFGGRHRDDPRPCAVRGQFAPQIARWRIAAADILLRAARPVWQFWLAKAWARISFCFRQAATARI